MVMMMIVAGFFTGCGTFRGWGQKSAGSTASVGAGISVPLGKE